MPGLVPGIHAFLIAKQAVDGRDKPGHDVLMRRDHDDSARAKNYCGSKPASLTTFWATTRSRFMSAGTCSGVLAAGTRLRAVR